MSLPHHNGPDLAAEVLILKRLVSRLLRTVESDAEPPKQFPSFARPSAFRAPFITSCRSKTAGPGRCTTLTVVCELAPKLVVIGGGNASTKHPKTIRTFSCASEGKSNAFPTGIELANTRWPNSGPASSTYMPTSLSC